MTMESANQEPSANYRFDVLHREPHKLTTQQTNQIRNIYAEFTPLVATKLKIVKNKK